MEQERRRVGAIVRCAGFAAGILGAGIPAGAQIGDFPGEKQLPVIPLEKIPPSPAFSPEEALASFQLAPGIRLEIAASEPLVQDPVAIAFAPDGAMWVVEMRGFMPDVDGSREDEPNGRVVILRDTDGDGRFDRSTVFVDGLVMPRALALVGHGALIGAPPELAFWEDTDGDGKADRKTVVATDFGVQGDPKRPHLAGPERAPNSLLWALDNWIYSSGYVRKFRRVNGAWETGPMKFYGQFGLAQDDFGRLYFNFNSDHLRADVIAADYLRRNPHYPKLGGANVKVAADQSVWPARVSPGINRGYMRDMLRDDRLKAFTAACAPWVYRGDLLPEFYGDVFVAEPAGNLVRRAIVKSAGGTLQADNAYARAEFVASKDERFRPVNFATGPDGALYLVDMYRGIIQHRMSFTTYLRGQVKARSLENPVHLGRIYRVVPADWTPERGGRFVSLDTPAVVRHLAHPNAWFRETAQRLLVERRDPAAVPLLTAMVRSAPGELGRLHALWTLAGMDAVNLETVNHALGDAAATVAVTTIRLTEKHLATDQRANLIRRLTALCTDRRPEVQLQAVLSLGEAGDPAVDVVVAGIVRTSSGHGLLKDAFLSGLRNREWTLLERLLSGAKGDASAVALAGDLAAGVLASRQADSLLKLLAAIARESCDPAMRGSVVAGLAVGTGSLARRPLQLPAKPPELEALAADTTLRPALAKFTQVLSWPGRERAGRAAAARLSDEEQQRFEAGKTFFAGTCATCHQASGSGLAGLAPPLLDSEWVLGSPDRLVRIILHGLRGPIVVAGESYTGDMPGFGLLTDEQVLSVATYVRREWGHSAAPISPAQVSAVRQETEGRQDAWTARELTKMKIE
jgi:mono/diheme cytochrome c family protein/glucose/arabinose dehydrogenase